MRLRLQSDPGRGWRGRWGLLRPADWPSEPPRAAPGGGGPALPHAVHPSVSSEHPEHRVLLAAPVRHLAHWGSECFVLTCSSSSAEVVKSCLPPAPCAPRLSPGDLCGRLGSGHRTAPVSEQKETERELTAGSRAFPPRRWAPGEGSRSLLPSAQKAGLRRGCGWRHPSQVPCLLSPVTLAASPAGRGVFPFGAVRFPRPRVSGSRCSPVVFPQVHLPKAMFSFF